MIIQEEEEEEEGEKARLHGAHNNKDEIDIV